MAPTYHLDDLQIIERKIHDKAHDLFKVKPGKAQLQVTRISKRISGKQDENQRTVFVKDLDVSDLAQVKELRDVSHPHNFLLCELGSLCDGALS